MLLVKPVEFYISKVIVDPDNEKIAKVMNDFDQILLKIKEDDRFKNLELQKSPFKHIYKEDGEIKSSQIRWYGSAPSELIREFIDRWNECDGKNELNLYHFHYIFK